MPERNRIISYGSQTFKQICMTFHNIPKDRKNTFWFNLMHIEFGVLCFICYHIINDNLREKPYDFLQSPRYMPPCHSNKLVINSYKLQEFLCYLSTFVINNTWLYLDCWMRLCNKIPIYFIITILNGMTKNDLWVCIKEYCNTSYYSYGILHASCLTLNLQNQSYTVKS